MIKFILEIILGIGSIFGLYLVFLIMKDKAEEEKINRILNRKEEE